MQVLVVGSGGREHAICWKLKQDRPDLKLYCAPGNGGIAELAELMPIEVAEIEQLLDFAISRKIDVTIVGPELPLSLGIVDRFQAAGLKIFGPTRAAAEIEASKAFAKDLMERYGIPTAAYQAFSSEAAALEYIETQALPLVVKADGLAAGKGVVICADKDQAKAAVRESFKTHPRVVIEEFLIGEELSLMAFVDGTTVLPMAAAQDHKQVFEGDQGPNTGGMGAYSPVPHLGEKVTAEAVERVLIPAAEALVKEGRSFTGVLYAGLMLTEQGLKVIEFNARFGDPETQVVLPRLEADLLEIILACAEHRLDGIDAISWSNEAAVAVVMASRGYPGVYEKGKLISGIDRVEARQHTAVFHAGTSRGQDGLVTAGGRVVAVVGQGDTLELAKKRAYEGVSEIRFEGMHYRRDIADKALIRS
ncbi:MAG: phosphoribosylamine--glycine ligase [Candidatus Wallacebacter cryptica]|nr:phosphoribosylamine--glycine ligase [Bacillota bacterium]